MVFRAKNDFKMYVCGQCGCINFIDVQKQKNNLGRRKKGKSQASCIADFKMK